MPFSSIILIYIKGNFCSLNLQRIWRSERQSQPKVESVQIGQSVNDLTGQNMHTKMIGELSQLDLRRFYNDENIFKHLGKENLGLNYSHLYCYNK